MNRPVQHLRFKRAFFEATPHLFGAEIRVSVVSLGDEGANDIFLHKEGDKRVYFRQLDVMGARVPESPFELFKDGLAHRCQQEPILCDAEGFVMDGYARWFALAKLGIQPKFEIVGNLPDDGAKITWIRQRKLARHHLTEKERMGIVKAEITAHPDRTSNWTAELLGVSPTTVTKYRADLERDGQIGAVHRLMSSDGQTVPHSPKNVMTPQERKREVEENKEKGAAEMRKKAMKALPNNYIGHDSLSDSLRNMANFFHEAMRSPDDRLARSFREEVGSVFDAAKPFLPKRTALDDKDIKGSVEAISTFLGKVSQSHLEAFPRKARTLLNEMVTFWQQRYADFVRAVEGQVEKGPARVKKARKAEDAVPQVEPPSEERLRQAAK